MKPHVAFTRYKLSHVLGDYFLTDPGYHPYYGRNFFQLIKYAREKAPLNPVLMGMKE